MSSIRSFGIVVADDIGQTETLMIVTVGSRAERQPERLRRNGSYDAEAGVYSDHRPAPPMSPPTCRGLMFIPATGHAW